ncbi:MAG TPA: transferrin receptor-like dimerization domain-containing protein [Thermoanaerobaculia bacterium]|nr:transferrin receptor-like dimerization domain-containing protein [Thermoanaerobaculia bacterium]
MHFRKKVFAAVLLPATVLLALDNPETAFRKIPDAVRIRENNRTLSAQPHHLGSPYDAKNAQWILEQFRSYGLDASIETFHVLFPTPKERVLELLEPTRFRAALAEPPVAGDPTSGQTREQLPTYNAYSIDGDVTAPLVYVNYGVPADYERLERLGVDVKGKIVIARYGASWRGIKPKVAAEHGALACLIYSDPRDDGYFAGDVYPKGALRPEQGVQRGSVADMPLYSGDPLTPGVGATKNVSTFDLKDAKTLTKIPVLPISYGDARPLLSALAGPVAPAEWRGALPLTYHVGPGPAKVHLKLAFDWKIVPANDVIARIPGTTYPDEWILHGNHHDAWVNGSSDPTSGMSALLEEARAFGELVRQGWKPKRTILLCAWDGEEEGLFGSTEWVETHADELAKKAVVYINSDSNGRGFLEAGGSHTLEPFLNAVAEAVMDPEKNISVGERRRAREIQNARTADERKHLREKRIFPLEALGSGSDFTPFLQHLGVASLNLGFGGEGDGGVYHSIYDDFAWYTRFSDTDFSYGRALAQTIGTAVLRLADADLLPFEPAALSAAVARYTKEVQDLARERREAAEELGRQIDEGVPSAAADPKEPFVAPKKEMAVPYFDFSPLENASAALDAAAKRYDEARTAATAGTALDAGRVARANAALRDLEGALTRPQGLPGRPWYRHYVYAPGFYTGYSVKTLPAVREAIEQKQYGDVNARISETAQALAAAAAKVTEAGEALKAK